MSEEYFEIAAPECPICKGGMREVNGARGKFLGCNNFPRCRGSRQLGGARPKSYAPTKATESINHAEVVGSPEQETIWNTIENQDCHVVVRALAGTGKSFTCRHAMHRIPMYMRVLYLAFNKDIVNEFRVGAPRNADIKTLNAIGNQIVKDTFPGAMLDNDKVANIVAELAPPNTRAEMDNFHVLTATVEKMVSHAQGYLIDGTNRERLLDIAERHEVQLEDEIRERVLDLVPQVLDKCRERHAVITFNEQLWLPVIMNLPCPKYDVIFVDEAQDLNTLQHHLVMKLLAPNGRVVVVGDDHQAIYGFRGSDVDSIKNFCVRLQATGKPIVELPLTVTRRCPKAVVEYARRWVPSLRALPEAPQGQVIPTCAEKAERLYRTGDMVLCRCNAPLTSIAFQLIKRGVKAVIRGRDIGQGLIALMKKLRAADVNDLLRKLDQWVAKEVAKLDGNRRAEQLAQVIFDKADCIRALATDCDSVLEVMGRISSIFEDFKSDGKPSGAVVMSSIHRAKGLEAERVFWVKPSLTCKSTQEWQWVQEDNLKYVATTRAKNQLFLVYDDADDLDDALSATEVMESLIGEDSVDAAEYAFSGVLTELGLTTERVATMNLAEGTDETVTTVFKEGQVVGHFRSPLATPAPGAPSTAQTTSEGSEAPSCACGCGAQVAPGRKWKMGHNARKAKA